MFFNSPDLHRVPPPTFRTNPLCLVPGAFALTRRKNAAMSWECQIPELKARVRALFRPTLWLYGAIFNAFNNA
jgi:hypothetical protein